MGKAMGLLAPIRDAENSGSEIASRSILFLHYHELQNERSSQSDLPRVYRWRRRSVRFKSICGVACRLLRNGSVSIWCDQGESIDEKLDSSILDSSISFQLVTGLLTADSEGSR